MSTDAVIVGAGMTHFGKHPDRSMRSLAAEAVAGALADAGLQPSDVGMVFHSNAVAGILHGQEMICGQATLRETGLWGGTARWGGDVPAGVVVGLAGLRGDPGLVVYVGRHVWWRFGCGRRRPAPVTPARPAH